MKSLREQAGELPQTAGVYRFDDASGRPLYIGKAINLRRRVHQHLDRPMRDGLLDGAVTVEVFETEDENSALALERKMIYRHRPLRNIRLPGRPLMLCITDDDYPRMLLTRALPEPGWTVFGPYQNSGAARRLLETLEATFQIRSCTGKKPGRPQTPCLDFYLGRCSAPCDDRVSKEQYQKQIESAIAVLRGRTGKLSDSLRAAMEEASARQDYERAGQLRDQIKAVDSLTGRHYLVGGGSYDALALARDGDRGVIELRRVRQSQLSDVTRLPIEASSDISNGEVLRQFLVDHVGEIAKTVVVEEEIDESELSDWRKLKLEIPQKGDKYKQLQRAKQGAEQSLAKPDLSAAANPLDALEELQTLIGLDSLPLTVECVDISNIGARQTTGGIVRMTAGQTFESKALRLKEREKPNDVAAIGELLTIRKEIEDWHDRPDLLVVDGGKGQLNRAVSVLDEWIEAGLVVVSLAKREELVFLAGQSEPLRPEGQALRLLQRLRDQTHNTAISAHRRRRDQDTTASPLDGIRGIGPGRRKMLIAHFGSLDSVIAASEEELAAVVPRDVAARIKRSFR